MSEFKHWISYIYAYNGEIKAKNAGFAKIDVREGRCRMNISVRGAYGCDARGLDIGLYIRKNGRPERRSVGHMRVMSGRGDFSAATGEDNLFQTGLKLNDIGGLWLKDAGKETNYLTSWEKGCLDIRDFLPYAAFPSCDSQPKAAQLPVPSVNMPSVKASSVPVLTDQEPELETLPQPSLWESLCRYYPKAAPELLKQGVEVLQIRPADIRYLPQRLWHFGSNSFLLHGYYRYKHLVLGRMNGEEGEDYILGVRGIRDDRERFSAGLFGFQNFLPLQEGPEGYWYTRITL